MTQLPKPSFNDDPKSFAFPSAHKRWPTILKGAIDDVNQEIKENPDLKKSGEEIRGKIESFLQYLENDGELKPFTKEDIELNADLKYYNSSLEEMNKEKRVTWLTGRWLNTECFLYQILKLYFLQSSEKHWHQYDVFERLKNNTFHQSDTGVLELCKRYNILASQLAEKDIDLNSLGILFKEFIDISLWGNATDLSLLAGNVTLEEIKSAQGEENRKKNEKNIVVNDISDAWGVLSLGNLGKRVDIILDNAGFELFADLILVLFLLDSNIASEVHLHCKEIPWFVSDVMPKDFGLTLKMLSDQKFFPAIYSNKDDAKAITDLHDSISKYHNSGKIVVQSHKFWTLDHKFWSIPKFEDLYKELLKSDLIILKGDLNYRKLTGDLFWDPTTPFKVAIQDLANSKLPLLSLRTCKADVVVGLEKGLFEKLSEEYKAQGNELGSYWTTTGKWAVISFSDGRS